MGRPISLQQTLEQVLNVGNAAGAKDIVLSDVTSPPLKFGGTTASFPALRRNGTGLDAVLADASAFVNMTVANLTATGVVRVGNLNDCVLTRTASGSLQLDNGAGAFSFLQFGGTSASFPAIKRTGTGFQLRLADDSANAGVLADHGDMVNGVTFGASADVNVSRAGAGLACFGTGAPGNTGGSWLSTNGSVLGYLEWFGATRLVGTTNGSLVLSNQAQTSFGLLQLGGTTSSFPALKRNSAQVDFRLADDSAYATVNGANFLALASGGSFFTGTNGSIIFENGSGSSITGGGSTNNLLMRDNATTSFGRLQFGGTTSSFPAIKRNGAGLDVRLADDTAYALFAAGNFQALASQGSFFTGTNGYVVFENGGGATITGGGTTGSLYLQDHAGTSFALLGFGGSTSSFPALKRDGQNLDVRLADDSAYAGLYAGNLRQYSGTKLQVNMAGVQVNLASTASLNFYSLDDLNTGGGTLDTVVFRNSAGTLSQTSGLNPTCYELYNTTDFSGNAEWLQALWSGNIFYLRTVALGTGVGRTMIIGPNGAATLALQTNGIARWDVDFNGMFIAQTDNAYDIGYSGSQRPRDFFLAGKAQVSGTGSTHGEAATISSASEEITLSTSGTTTDSAANLLPADAIILSVSTRITATITTATAWQVGDATTANRFVTSQSTLTSGFTKVGLNHNTVAGNQNQASAAKVRITTTGTPGAGKIRVTVHYMTFTAPTS